MTEEQRSLPARAATADQAGMVGKEPAIFPRYLVREALVTGSLASVVWYRYRVCLEAGFESEKSQFFDETRREKRSLAVVK